MVSKNPRKKAREAKSEERKTLGNDVGGNRSRRKRPAVRRRKGK